jgi:hypothetical protein
MRDLLEGISKSCQTELKYMLLFVTSGGCPFHRSPFQVYGMGPVFTSLLAALLELNF